MQRRFVEVDVFGAGPYRGNPLAVVVDGDDLTDDEMQRFANWTNFSETTFLLPPTDPSADYRVRIFATTTELPFAGHPTLGSAYVWLASGGEPRDADRVVQECGIGLVEIRRDASSDARMAFAAPPLVRSGPLEPEVVDEVAVVLGVDPTTIVDAQWIDNGPGWLGVLLDSAATVLSLRPANSARMIGVVGPYPPGSRSAYEVRGFFPEGDVSVEDPVTGSLNASVAQWMITTGRCAPPYEASQGAAVGRAGRVHVTADPTGRLWIAGAVSTCVTGTVDL